MIRTLGLIALVFLISSSLFAQGPTSYWHFGYKAGMHFEDFTPSVILNNGMDMPSGCSSISSSHSKLLYYARPDSCQDRNHNGVFNSSGIEGNYVSDQGALFITNPSDPSVQHLITIDLSPEELMHHTIRSSLIHPLGTIDSSEKNQLLSSSTQRRLTAVLHSNGHDIWVIHRKSYSNQMHAYLITEEGLQSTPVISILDTVNSPVGQLKASPSGKFLSETHSFETGNPIKASFYRFDATSGMVTDQIQIVDNFLYLYGVEFSASSRYVYFTAYSPTPPHNILRYDLSSYDSTSVISSCDTFLGKYAGSMQIGIDRKIYIATDQDDHLGCIHNPDEPNIDSIQFSPNEVDLQNRLSGHGLPDFLTSYFRPGYFDYWSVCEGSPTQFKLRYPSADSVYWNFGDPNSAQNTSSNLNPQHAFTDTGIFSITVVLWDGVMTDTFSRDVEIIRSPQALNFSDTIETCGMDTVFYNIYQDVKFVKYLWSTGSESSNISIQDTGMYWATAYNQCDTLYDSVYVKSVEPLNIELPASVGLCKGDSVIIGPAPTKGFTWFNGDTINTRLTVYFDSSNTNGYMDAWLIAENACGSDTDTVAVHSYSSPNLYWFHDSMLCDYGTTVLQPDLIQGVSYQFLYKSTEGPWDTLSVWGIAERGVYRMIAYNQCDTVIREAFLSPDQVIKTELPRYVELCEDESILLDASWMEATYEWTNNVPENERNQGAVLMNGSSLISEITTVSVVVSSPPCTKVLSTDIALKNEGDCIACQFSIPNVITPNGDGLNDRLEIATDCNTVVYKAQIFNRWGQVVATLDENFSSWDGYLNGEPATSGTYYYVLSFKNKDGVPKEHRGFLQLLRN